MRFQSLLRIFFLLSAAFLLLWSICDPQFYDSEGSLQKDFALFFSAGISFLVLAFSLSRFGFWIATGLLGQAVLLQMIDAGKRLHYQHYRPLDAPGFVLILFLLQTILVFIGVWKHRTVIGRWVQHHGAIFGIGCFLMATVSVAVSEDASFFTRELLFGFFAAIIQIGNLFLIIREVRDGYVFRRLNRFFNNENQIQRDRFGIYIAIWVSLAAALLSLIVYERHPHVNDEVAYLFQARVLAQGALTIEAPPEPKAFAVYLFEYSSGRMFVVPPPGWPAMLAIGAWLKIPWLINPILSGVNILLVYFVLTRLYNRRIARISILLLAFSPWYLFMGMNFMTHQWATTCALICAAGVVQARGTSKARWAFLSGIFLGIQSLIRPLDGLILGLLIGLWSLGFGGRRLKFSSLIVLGLGTLLTGSLIFPYNRYFTGDALTYPINTYNEALFGKNANAYGFGKDHGMEWPLDPLPGHGPLDALINAQLNTSQINVEMFGWSTGSLWLALFLVLSWPIQKRDFPFIAVLIAVFTGYFFYYFSGGPDFGARYWYLMFIPLVALTVRGSEWLQTKIAPGGHQVLAAMLTLIFFSFINYFPWRATDKYHHYLEMRPEICSIVTTKSANGDLVLIQGERFPDYASAMACNPLDLRNGSPVYTWYYDRGTEQIMEKYYPERAFWIVRGPSLTGRGYEVSKISE